MPKMVWDPATGNYVYADDAQTAPPDPSITSDTLARALGMDASGSMLGTQAGIMPGASEQDPQFTNPTTPAPTGASPSLPSQVQPDPTAVNDPTANNAPGMEQYGYDPNDPAFGTYDPTWEQAQQKYTMGRNQAENDYATGMQQLQSYYPGAKSQLDMQNSDQLEMLKNALAGQGMLRSSNYAQAQGRQQGAYQDQMDALTGQQQSSENYLNNQHLNAIQNALFGLDQARSGHSNFLATASNARQAAISKAMAAQQAAMALAQQAAAKNPLTMPSNTGINSQPVQQGTTTNPIGIVAPGSPLDYSGQQPDPSYQNTGPQYTPAPDGSYQPATDPTTGQQLDPEVLKVLLQLGLYGT